MAEGDTTAKDNPKSRRPHPKTHGGCLTCKIRRVKCDEQRPFCQRCHKFGAVCDGYISQKNKAKKARLQIVPLLPKTRDILPLLAPTRAPSPTRFDSEDEARYFNVFSTNTAYELLPSIEMGKLRTILLQACDAKPSIRQAVTALGALDMTSQASEYAHTSHLEAGCHVQNANYHFAVTAYARAIKSAQADKATDLRTALITSLLILSFESWLGNHEQAFQQIQIGTKFLKEWTEQNKARTVAGYAEPQVSSEEGILSHIFNRLSMQLRALPPTETTEPADLAAPKTCTPIHTLQMDELDGMPETFYTLAEAGYFYNIIVHAACRYVAPGVPHVASADSLPGAYTPEGPYEVIPPEISAAQADMTEALRRWMAAFAPLKAEGRFKSTDEMKASITLELHIKAIYMGTMKSLARDEMVYDAYDDIYTDIVELSEKLITLSPASKVPKFSFDTGVIIPLWFTGHKCRNPTIRRKVISLLVNYPRREGVWDSVFLGLVIEVIKGFEEAYSVDGKIPEFARIATTSLDVDLGKRTVEVKCLQRTSVESEEMVERRKTIRYYVDTGTSIATVGGIVAQ